MILVRHYKTMYCKSDSV